MGAKNTATCDNIPDTTFSYRTFTASLTARPKNVTSLLWLAHQRASKEYPSTEISAPESGGDDLLIQACNLQMGALKKRCQRALSLQDELLGRSARERKASILALRQLLAALSEQYTTNKAPHTTAQRGT